MLLFSSDLLGTVKRAPFVPHSQRPKISLLLLLSECCSLLAAAGREVGTCSAVPRGLITIAAGRKTTQNQHTCSSSQVPCLRTALPRHGHTLPLLQLSSKHSVLGVPECIHLPETGSCTSGAVQPSSCPVLGSRTIFYFGTRSSNDEALVFQGVVSLSRMSMS